MRFAWVKRNKLAAVVMTPIAMALVVGSAVSLAFAFAAKREADRANIESQQAKANEEAATLERNAALATRYDLQSTNDRLNSALARAMFVSFAGDERDLSLTSPELDTLWCLAGQRGTPENEHFLVEGFRSPFSCKQLACRSEWAFHAAIGLDLARRARAETLMLAALDRPEIPDTQRIDLALACCRSEGLFPASAKRVAAILMQAMGREKSPEAQSVLFDSFDLVLTQMEPCDAAEFSARAARVLVDVMAKTPVSHRTDPDGSIDTAPSPRGRLAWGLAMLASRMDHADAAKVAEKAAIILIDGMDTTRSAKDRDGMLDALVSMVHRLETGKATNTCDKIVHFLIPTIVYSKGDENIASKRQVLIGALNEVVGKMQSGNPEKDIRAVTGIISDIKQAPQELLARLNKAAERMEPDDAAALLTELMGLSKEISARIALSEALNLVAKRIEPDTSAAMLLDLVGKRSEASTLAIHARGLAEVAGRMEHTRANQICRKAADRLIDAMDKNKDPMTLCDLANGLAGVAGKMEPAAANEVCGKAVAILIDTLDRSQANMIYHIVICLTHLAGSMESTKAISVLLNGMEKIKGNSFAFGAARYVLTSVVRMKPIEDRDAGKVVAILFEELKEATGPDDLLFLAEALAKLFTAKREITLGTNSFNAERAYSGIIKRFEAIEARTKDFAVDEMAEVLSDLATKMEPRQAIVILAATIPKISHHSNRRIFSRTLTLVAVKLPPDKAACFCQEAVKTLTSAIAKSESVSTRTALSASLATVAVKLDSGKDPQLSETAAKTLLDAMDKTTSASDLGELAACLTAIAMKLEPGRATQLSETAAKTLLDAMGKTPEPPELSILAGAFARIAAKLQPVKAAQLREVAAKALLDEMGKNQQASDLGTLAAALTNLAATMEPRQASPVFGDAEQMISVAIADTIDAEELGSLAEYLVLITARMDHDKAAGLRYQAARKIGEVMTRTSDDSTALGNLSYAFMTLLSGVEVSCDTIRRRPQGCLAAASLRGFIVTTAKSRAQAACLAAGLMGGSNLLLSGIPMLDPEFYPQFQPLPPQQLVEFLKHPLCVRGARRFVLDCLEEIYRRPFADQWEFVRFASDNKIPLDLTSPPTRLQIEMGPGR